MKAAILDFLLISRLISTCFYVPCTVLKLWEMSSAEWLRDEPAKTHLTFSLDLLVGLYMWNTEMAEKNCVV